LTREKMSDTKPSISLLVPAYNEEATLESVIQRSLGVLEECTDDYEVVILDDGSSDRTGDIMEDLQRSDPARIRTLRHDVNRGIAATFQELYQAASKDYVLLIPADDQFPPEVLWQIVPMLSTHDIVVCRRRSKPYGAWRHVVSACFRSLPRLLFGVELYDPGSIKCVKREVIASIPITSKGVFAEAERLIRAAGRGYVIGAVDIAGEPRRAGTATGARPRLVIEAAKEMLLVWVALVLFRRKA
jgi:glycosyltransferase involved in cell wall biosynthesis